MDKNNVTLNLFQGLLEWVENVLPGDAEMNSAW